VTACVPRTTSCRPPAWWAGDLRAIALRDLGRPAAALPLFERQIEHDEAQTPVRVPIMRLHRGWLWASIGQWARALQDILPQDRFADLPGWAWARALHLRARVARRARR
jgi:hypothetical protein